jgi:hypothetical protein
MVIRKDPRSQTGMTVESVNGIVSDKTTNILGVLNTAIGFQGTGSQNYILAKQGEVEEISLAVHNIEDNQAHPYWETTKSILFQSAPDRLHEIKTKLEQNINTIEMSLIGNIDNLFSVVQKKEEDLNPLETALLNASDYSSALAAGAILENNLSVDKLASELTEIYFGPLFSLNNLELKIREEIFGLIGNDQDEYSKGSTERPQYFINFPKRDVSKEDIYNRFTNEVRIEFENSYGAGSWSKENYLEKMFDTKQIELNNDSLNAILASKNRNRKEFSNNREIINLVQSFDELLEITGSGTNNNQTQIENLFKNHLSKYKPPIMLIDVADTKNFLKVNIKKLETAIRDFKGDAEWETNLEDFQIEDETIAINFNILNENINNLIQAKKLKFEPEFLNFIIEQKNLSEDDLKKLQGPEELLETIDKEELYTLAGQFYNQSDNKNITVDLFLGNIKQNTSLYYEDERTLTDLLEGKQTNNRNDLNTNKIFKSMKDQIIGSGQATLDILQNGYDRVAKNTLQEYIRGNPLNTAIFFEDYFKENKANLNNEQQISIQKNIKTLLDRFQVLINNQKSGANKNTLQELARLNTAINSYEPEEGKDLGYIAEQFANLNPSIKNKFRFSAWPEELQDKTPENLSLIENEIKETTKIYNAQNQLYAMEMLETNKKNSSWQQRKLPEIKEGQEPIQETAPPLISPTILSMMIAAIGNQAIERASSIVEGEHPDKQWLINNSNLLKTIDENLRNLGSDADRSKLFVDGLKNKFVNIVREFLINKSDTRSAANNAKSNLVNNNRDIKKLHILTGTDSNFNFGSGNLDLDLNQIESELGELMNLETINSSSNKICKAGLKDTKEFLENTALNLQQLILNPPEGSNLDDLQQKLSKVYDLLYGENNSATNASTGSILERFTTLTNDINTACANKPDDVTQMEYLQSKEREKITEYKNALKQFSDDMTNLRDSDNINIEEALKETLSNNNQSNLLDLDNNGTNDLKDLKDLANMISGNSNSLSTTFENIFGTDRETGKNIQDMGLRRLILVMYLFTLMESGDWSHQIQEFNSNQAE